MDTSKVELLFELVHMCSYSLAYRELLKILTTEEVNLLNKLRQKYGVYFNDSDSSEDEDEDKQIKRDRELIDIFQACIKDIKRKGLQK